MTEYSIFEIVGPIMIGPSSSHTAGANRIGYIAHQIIGEEIKNVIFYLHGSFAETYKGHGTDKALLAGILGYRQDDERIREIFDIADKNKINYKFITKDLGEVHPNTAKIEVTTSSGDIWAITGASIGGGKIEIININETEVSFDGEYNTLITYHKDRPGVISFISSILANYNINIANMKLTRKSKGDRAILILETDDDISKECAEAILENDKIYESKVINKIVDIV